MSETIICPHCNAEVEVETAEPGSAVICPKCEYFWQIPKPRKQLQKHPEKQRGMLITCPNCMKEFGVEDASPDLDVNCPFCGFSLMDKSMLKPSATLTYVAIIGIWVPYIYLAGIWLPVGIGIVYFYLVLGALWWIFISWLLWNGWKDRLACWDWCLMYNRLNNEIQKLKSDHKSEVSENKEAD